MSEFIATLRSTSGEWEIDLLALPPGDALGIIRHLRSDYWKYFDRKREGTRLTIPVKETKDNHYSGRRRFIDGSVYFSIPLLLLTRHEKELHVNYPRPEVRAKTFSPPIELHCEEKTYRRHESRVTYDVFSFSFRARLRYLDDARARGEIEGTSYTEPREFSVARAKTYFKVPVRLQEEDHYVWQSIQIHVQFKLPPDLIREPFSLRNWRAREVHRLRLEEIAAGISKKKR